MQTASYCLYLKSVQHMVITVFQMVNNQGFFGIQRNRQKQIEPHYRIFQETIIPVNQLLNLSVI